MSLNASSSNILILENILRPNEIQSCTWMNIASDGTRILPHTCACYNTSDKQTCVSGYQSVRVENLQPVLEKNPDSLITWCVNNIPNEISNNSDATSSWVIGCLNGIRGPHKIV